VYGALGFIRQDRSRVVAYLSQISDAWHRLNSAQMDVSDLARAVGAPSQLRLVNLLTKRSVTVQLNDGAFKLEMSQLGVDDDSKFCLLEAFPA
jgi:uncharacterized protein (DUF2236 family)